MGLVVTRRADGALVVEGGGATGGRRVLDRHAPAGRPEGPDPLAAYGPGAAADLLDLDRRDHVGDVVVLGRFDPALGEVAAFEELVGSHGGLGGDQTRALLVHPAGWAVAGGRLTGPDVHRLLLGRLVDQGLRDPDGDSEAVAQVEAAS